MKSHFQRMSLPKGMWQVALGAIALFAVVVLVDITGSNAQAQMPMSSTSSATGKGRAAAPLAEDRIAFSSKRDGQFGTDIYTMDSDGNNVIRLTTGGDEEDSIAQPTWSPDRSKIAYIEAGPGCNCSYAIYVMNADGSNQHPVYTSKPSEYPAWSPDGTRIAFETLDTYDIYVMNADGSHVTPLTTDATQSYSPSWSPDSSQIAFANTRRDGDDDTEIYVMNSNGSDQHVIADPTSPQSYFLPAWSPDGLKIAFAVRGGAFTGTDPRHIEGGCSVRIYTMNSDGSGMTPVTSGPCDSYPTWSPDSSKIAYDHDEVNVSTQIYVIDVDGSNDHSISGTSDSDYDPNWQRISPVILVQNDQGTPVAGAQVYTNTQGVGYPDTLLGTTNQKGILSWRNPLQNEYVIARSLVYTGTTGKAAHNGWAYHVWLTDIDQQTDGTQTPYTITDTSKLTQTITLKRDNAQIGLNIVGSFNYNASSEALQSARDGMQSASKYLFDVTDGQMFYEDFSLHEDNQNFTDADIQFQPSVWPAADPDGPLGMTSTTDHLYMPGPGFDGHQYWGGWVQPNAYRTFVHEFGHYAFGAFDEYQKIEAGKEITSTCTLDAYSFPEDSRASIMNYQYNSTEICEDSDHNNDTDQGQINNESVWATFVRNWSDNLNRWTLISPMTRNDITDPGPFTLPGMDQMNSTITEVSPQACYAIPAKIKITLGGVTYNASTVPVYLQHNGRTIDEGPTEDFGIVNVYGALIGDTISVSGVYTPNTTYTGSYTVAACNDTPTIELRPAPLLQRDRAESPATLPASFSRYWLTSTLNYTQNRLDITLHFDGAPLSAPTLSVSQDGGTGTAVSLTYNPSTLTYSGSYTVNPTYGLNFTADVRVASGSQTLTASYRIVGAQYVAAGLAKGQGIQQTPLHLAAPSGWTLFPPENMVTLSVNASSLPDGTTIDTGETNLPAAPPTGKSPVGGPYFIQGDRSITGQMGMALNYQAAYFCGLQPNSVSIYRYNGSGWTAVPTTLNDAWNRAYAGLSQWGIYAVFATSNTPLTFSDVPQSNTFYNYISWIACHGVASGYSDGTFRLNNNATRGQITKMVVLAFRWNQELPTTNTFADVPPGSTFYAFVEAAYRMGVFSGYQCGGPREPCDGQHRPYFRPGAHVTRGQIAKILSNSAVFNEQPTGQTFADVPTGSTFYEYVERMASRGIIGGYACGGPGEPCDTQHRPYFRPNNNATRGQLSKMIYLALQPR